MRYAVYRRRKVLAYLRFIRPSTGIAHGLPTNRKLETGDLVMIDIHPMVNGYSSDKCRTVCVGKPSDEQQLAYDLYLNAQQASIAKVKAGIVA